MTVQPCVRGAVEQRDVISPIWDIYLALFAIRIRNRNVLRTPTHINPHPFARTHAHTDTYTHIRTPTFLPPSPSSPHTPQTHENAVYGTNTKIGMTEWSDHYATLGLQDNASSDDIRAAYKRLALKHHPDKNKGSPAAAACFVEVGGQTTAAFTA